jgi:hypothetical protein
VQTFDKTWDIVKKIDGQLTKEEARELWQLMAFANGDIVEVGCKQGQVSTLLAGEGPVVCVDTFSDNFNEQPQDYQNWRKNIIESGLAGNIEILPIDYSYHLWESPVGLLYVDMPASDSTMRQLLGWEAHMQRGAVLVMRGKIAPPKSFKIEKMVGGLTIYRKL